MSVAQNMGFNLLVRGVPRRDIDEKVRKAAAIVNLTSHLAYKPAQLSGGQRQRVAMGRAIIRDPKVFLFDEPLSNLDAQLRVAMRAEVKELQRKLATTTIYVTHDQIEAMTMADRIVIMHEGRIEQVGSPLQVYDHPVNTFVARFIGSPAMNLLPGKLARHGARATVVLDGGAIVDVPGSCSGADGQLVHFGIRPEHLAIGVSGKGLAGIVVGVESTGAQVIVVTEYGGQRIMTVLNDRVFPAIGSEMILTWQEKNCHVFYFQTGKSLLPAFTGSTITNEAERCP
jgi:multiple sugar transport system ATP-binding protein